ncbi:MAG: SufD family Fe-S cluster assembly protein [Pseudomonadales bacterium]|jgi:hypothetical protein
MADRLTPEELIGQLPVAEAGSDLLDRARTAVRGGGFREFWKYTPAADFISGLNRIDVQRPELDVPEDGSIHVDHRAVGTTLGAQDGASTERFPLADLALLLAGDAVIVDVTRSSEAPLRIRYGDGLTVPLLIRVGDGVSTRIIEESLGEGFGNQTLYLHLGRGASVEHASGALPPDACHWSLTQVSQAAGSRYTRQQYCTGGRKRRVETQILLNGPDASADIVGAYVVEDGTHLDQQLLVEHRSRATRSRQRFHGIGAGKGTTIFNGRIHIHPDSPGADAALTNRNLALHPDATINTKPELEIYTDDVKCSHGATVGQLSEESLFYLRSRGLDVATARRMLCRAFIRECVEGALAERAESTLLGAWTEVA